MNIYNLLVSVGFKGQDATPNLLINKTPMWIEKDNYVNAIKTINKGILDNYKIENFIAPSDMNLAKIISASN